MDFIILEPCILTVLIFNTLTIVFFSLKRRSDFDGAFREAAITVMTLSAIFVILNVFYSTRLAACCLDLEMCDPGNDNIKWAMQWLGLPLNSFLNPAVYFIRAHKMRAYVRSLVCGRFNDVIHPRGYCSPERTVSVSRASRSRMIKLSPAPQSYSRMSVPASNGDQNLQMSCIKKFNTFAE